MLFRSSDDRSNESRPLRRGTAACAQEAIERRGERWMTDSSAARGRSRMRMPAPALARPVPRTRVPTRTRTRTRTRAPYPRTHTRAAPRCRFPSQILGFATESGISMGKRGGKRAGSVQRRAGPGSRACGHGTRPRHSATVLAHGTRPRHSPTSSRPSSLPDTRSTASPVLLGSTPGDFGRAATAR